ncbi:mitoferrin-1-like isoform X2 [Limulus polyphemus]|uniref:Mitoferrin-1-like isoform X2 n=1 Tax=Limulus polyphemus TaxID=6850 RepID=A0ABM1TP14_LIMPO|nr:mitoferrin-1-like isoform X2 [Limulus polyphemus]
MEFEEYESLLPSSTVATHMVAGAAAGIMEHCLIYPIDSVKTRMQSLQPNPKATYHSISDALYKMVKYEGIFRPVRGMSAVVSGAGFAHALYFSCYEKMKRVFSGTETGAHSPISQVIKQRMQMFNSPYKNVIDCMKRICQKEGVWTFYRSYSTQLTMNIPFQIIHFLTYEFMQDLTNDQRTYDPKTHVVSGAVSGAFAAAVTTPLDVCKTLLNTQEHETLHRTKQSYINGLINATMTVYRFRGLRGYFQGFQARVVSHVPSTAVAWSVYEFFKHMLKLQQSLKDKTHEPSNPVHLQEDLLCTDITPSRI